MIRDSINQECRPNGIIHTHTHTHTHEHLDEEDTHTHKGFILLRKKSTIFLLPSSYFTPLIIFILSLFLSNNRKASEKTFFLLSMFSFYFLFQI